MSRARTVRRRAAIAAMLLLIPVRLVSAQTVVDPTKAEFDPSSDHGAVLSDGQPVVERYTLALYVAGSTSPIETVDLDKPAPDPDGKIRVNFVSRLATPPTPGVVYETRVSAEGPGGAAASAVSNTFSFQAPCTASLNPISRSLTATGGTGSVAVTVPTGCAWSAVSNVAWITLTGTTSGTGNGTVGYNVAVNTSTSSRTGTLTIAGLTFTVTQAANSCSYTVSPTTVSAASTGLNASISVTTGSSCAWTAVSNVGWITITSGASMSGLGSANFTVAANTTGAARTGTMTVAGQTVTVSQEANSCTFDVSPTSVSATSTGLNASVSVTTGSSCAWTAVSNVAWITITGGASMSGLGSANFTVAANATGAARTGTMTVAGKTVTVNQSAGSCTYSLSPSSTTAPSAAGLTTVHVVAPAGCSWTAATNVTWMLVTSGFSGSGNGTVGLSVGVNTGASPRTGTATIAGQTFTLTQDAAATTCSYSISPTAATAVAAGGSNTITVTTTAGCAWTAVSNVAWITIGGAGSGSGAGTVTYTVASNSTTSVRSGTITIGGRVFTLTQAAGVPPRAPTGLRIVQ